MKLLLLSVVCGLGSTATLVHSGFVPCPCELIARHLHGSGCGGAEPACKGQVEALTGDYIDARDCTVFGGACHINGEADAQGRSALAAWRLDAGGKVLAAVEGDTNLGRPNGGPAAERRAVLFVDGVEDVVALRLAESAGLEVVARHAAPVTWQRSGDQFHVAVEGVAELSGSALADRSCCAMPNLLWYQPLAGEAVRGTIVGNPSRCRFAGTDGLHPWTYEDANTVLLGRFEVSSPWRSP